ncbi:MAG: hypothetical protein K2P06_10430, partial [Muribaculaceae bacterium]|nr:hypothetical protein [Muribaculaceae bacterium]
MRKLATLTLAAGLLTSGVQAQEIVSTSAYTWTGDSNIKVEFLATAPSGTALVATSHSPPGEF